jgi:hypothetical protein
MEQSHYPNISSVYIIVVCEVASYGKTEKTEETSVGREVISGIYLFWRVSTLTLSLKITKFNYGGSRYEIPYNRQGITANYKRLQQIKSLKFIMCSYHLARTVPDVKIFDQM